jgi:hypothetical protein
MYVVAVTQGKQKHIQPSHQHLTSVLSNSKLPLLSWRFTNRQAVIKFGQNRLKQEAKHHGPKSVNSAISPWTRKLFLISGSNPPLHQFTRRTINNVGYYVYQQVRGLDDILIFKISFHIIQSFMFKWYLWVLWRRYFNVTITILDIIHRPVFSLKLSTSTCRRWQNPVSETSWFKGKRGRWIMSRIIIITFMFMLCFRFTFIRRLYSS